VDRQLHIQGMSETSNLQPWDYQARISKFCVFGRLLHAEAYLRRIFVMNRGPICLCMAISVGTRFCETQLNFWFWRQSGQEKF
jgi:hypothetical protein